MLIGDLALKDFLCRMSSIISRGSAMGHKITITFTDSTNAIDTSVELQSRALQLIEYFWWDFTNVEILNALDTDAAVATLKTIHAPKFETYLELAQHLETLRAEGNGDFESNNLIGALVRYERARQIYYASMQTRIGGAWRSNTGPDFPNLEEIRFALFSDISEAYLKLAKQSGPNQLQLGIAAFDAAKGAFPPPPYFRPSTAQNAKTSRCLGVAAHLIGDWTEAKWAFQKVTNLGLVDLAVQQELEEVTEIVKRVGLSRCHPDLLAARKKSKGWSFRFVAERMIPIKFE